MICGDIFEESEAAIEGFVEGVFFGGEGFFDDFGAGFELGKDVAEFRDEGVDEFWEEGFFAIEAEGAAVF